MSCKLPVKGRLILAGLLYTAATIAVWQHYFIKRVKYNRNLWPSGSTHRDQKLYVPPFVYATKHTILLTMAVLPLTMCRASIGALSRTILNKYLPFDSTTEVHQALGLWMGIQVMFAALGFIGQYGSLCAFYSSGSESVNFCARFGDEIMITGELSTVWPQITL